MRHGLVVAVAGLALALAGCVEPPRPPVRTLMPAPSDRGLPSPTTGALSAALDRWVADRNGSGVTAAVVTARGSWAGASGVDGAGRAVVPESAMAIGDITRTFVAAEVVLLADAGRVDLGAPVTEYVTLPWDARGASVRQALALRSGFPVEPAERLAEEAAADLDRSWRPEEVLASVDGDGPRGGQRGGAAFDNRLNYLVLGLVVERVTGERLADVLRRDLVEPAGLTRVWLQDGERPEPPVAAGGGDRLGLVDPGGRFLPSRSVATVLGAAAGAAADAPSVARWGYALYGGHVIDAGLVEQMTARDREATYGWGTQLLEVDGEPLLGHGGAVPGYHAVLQVWPARAAAVAVLVPSTAGVRLGTGVDASDLGIELHRVLAAGGG